MIKLQESQKRCQRIIKKRRNEEEMYIFPELRYKIMNDLRLKQ